MTQGSPERQCFLLYRTSCYLGLVFGSSWSFVSSALCRPARCEVPTGPREPRAQAEMVGLKARDPEGGLSHLASLGGREASGYVVCGFEYFWVYRSAFSCLYFPSLVEKPRTMLGWKMLCRHWRRELVGMQFLVYPPRMGSACVSLCVCYSPSFFWVLIWTSWTKELCFICPGGMRCVVTVFSLGHPWFVGKLKLNSSAALPQRSAGVKQQRQITACPSLI